MNTETQTSTQNLGPIGTPGWVNGAFHVVPTGKNTEVAAKVEEATKQYANTIVGLIPKGVDLEAGLQQLRIVAMQFIASLGGFYKSNA